MTVPRLPALLVALAVMVTGLVVTPASAQAESPVSGGLWMPGDGSRWADTRESRPRGRLAAGETLELSFPSADLGGIQVLNVTAVNPTAPGYLAALPADGSAPKGATSSVNFAPGLTVANMVAVPVVQGKVLIYNGSAGSVDVVVDRMAGYSAGVATEPGAFVALSPRRLADVMLAPGADTTVALPVAAGQTASAGMLNVTVDAPTAAGYVKAWPAGGAEPFVSTVNFEPRQTVANAAIVQAGTDGSVRLRNGSRGTLRLVVDVSGYFLSGTPVLPGAFQPVTPTRIVDSRIGEYLAAPLRHLAKSYVKVGGLGPIPSAALGIAANLTVTQPACDGFARLAPAIPDLIPSQSTVNYTRGRDVAGLATLPVYDELVMLQSYCATEVVLDVAGYYVGGPRSRSRGWTDQSYGDVFLSRPGGLGAHLQSFDTRAGSAGTIRMHLMDESGREYASLERTYLTTQPYDWVYVGSPVGFTTGAGSFWVKTEVLNKTAPSGVIVPKLVATEVSRRETWGIQDNVRYAEVELTVQVTNRTSRDIGGRVALICPFSTPSAPDGGFPPSAAQYGEAGFFTAAGSSSIVSFRVMESSLGLNSNCWLETFA